MSMLTYMNIILISGYIEFRFNLGSGTVILRSMEKIVIGSVCKLVAKRYLRDGMLTIEGQEDVAGKAEGDLKSLDLAESLFIGNVQTNVSKIFDNIGVRKGFVGCIRSLRIGHRQLDLNGDDSWEIVKIHNVHDCSKMPCASTPCKNNGTCIPEFSTGYNGNFSCNCPKGYIGINCETRYEVCNSKDNPCSKGTSCLPIAQGGFSCACNRNYATDFSNATITPSTSCSSRKFLCPHHSQNSKTHFLSSIQTVPRMVQSDYLPDFKSTSYLKYPTLTNVASSLVIELWVLSRSLDGLILYNGQKSNSSRGDFISINLVNGSVQYKFNLGSSIPNVRYVRNILYECQSINDAILCFIQLNLWLIKKWCGDCWVCVILRSCAK